MAELQTAKEIKLWPIDKLSAVEYNPNEQTDAQGRSLSESISRFGVVEPIIVNTYPGREGKIVGGYHRTKQVIAAGHEEIPAIEVYLDLEQERELNLRLNHNRGEISMQRLVQEFERVELEGIGMSRSDLEAFDEAVRKASAADKPPPEEFPDLSGDNVKTEHECPKCGYRFSGGSKVAASDEAPQEFPVKHDDAIGEEE